MPDNLAKKLTVNFPGGSLTATRGLLQVMFGANLGGLTSEGETQTISVKGYTKKRVIGGPSTNVAANTYTVTKYPTTSSGSAAGGEAIMIDLEGRKWTARLSGSHQAFAQFLLDNSGPLTQTIFWASEKGTKYGPFPG